MHWQDDAIILKAQPQGETSLVLTVLTHSHGLHAGMVRGGRSPKKIANYQLSNVLKLDWRARLAEHLGAFTAEVNKNYAAMLMDNGLALAAWQSAASLLVMALPERHPYPALYTKTRRLLDVFTNSQLNNMQRLVAYVEWEMHLLAELGFGLDLSSCVATGQNHDLVYVSPKSARAVSAAAGQPYAEKLLVLPPFLQDSSDAVPAISDIQSGLALGTYFLERNIIHKAGQTLPAARIRLIKRLDHMN